MEKMECDKDLPLPVVDEYKQVMREVEGKEVTVGTIERFAFYEEAKKCYCVIATR